MASGGPELGERTVGLVGFGDIAQAVARRLRPFGCSLFYYAPHRRPPEVEAGFGISYLPLEALFARCDLISLHCAVTHETRGMVDAALLERVRPGTILINTARGDLLDNLAVRQALIEGRLGGAGFDVLSPEPTPADHPLVDLPPEVRDRWSTPPIWAASPPLPSAAPTPGCGTRSALCWREAVPITWSTGCDPMQFGTWSRKRRRR